jgi:beta-lactamase superfamily II metal-dependent hydrolase
MSVDKSTMEVGTASKQIRNDRDRFFDVVEYQQDILQYLKQLEVSRLDFISSLDGF